MQEALQLHIQPEDASSPAQRPEAVRLRPVSTEVHAVCASQAAQATAHQRPAVRLSGVRQEVHQCEWTANALEDDQLQA